jgi:hypothetical protein
MPSSARGLGVVWTYLNLPFGFVSYFLWLQDGRWSAEAFTFLHLERAWQGEFDCSVLFSEEPVRLQLHESTDRLQP